MEAQKKPKVLAVEKTVENNKSTFQTLIASTVFFELLATGIIAFVNASFLPSSNSKCGSLSTAVNVVACIHYIRIWQLRSGPISQMSERAVMYVRYSDWFITVPFMAYEIQTLAETHPDYEPLMFSKEVSFLISALIILSGAVWMFATLKNARYVSLVISNVLFAVYVINILLNLSDYMNHFAAIYALTICWIGYPIIGIASESFKGSAANKSLFQDITYGLLDTVSKSGLAFYVALYA